MDVNFSYGETHFNLFLCFSKRVQNKISFNKKGEQVVWVQMMLRWNMHKLQNQQTPAS